VAVLDDDVYISVDISLDSKLYLNLSLVLFGVCCYAAASSLNSIEEEMIRFHRIKMMSPLFASHCLRKWKRSHALICDTIDAIDDCFGPTLFLSVTYILIQLIDGFFIQFPNCFCFSFEFVSFEIIYAVVEPILLVSLVCVSASAKHLRSKVQYRH